MHKEIAKDIAELRPQWRSLDFGSGRSASMPRNLVSAINKYCQLAVNRDGRGVTSATVAEVRTTLRHIRSALRKASSGRNGPAGPAAKKLLKSLHHESDFEVMAERARAYAGRLQRLGRRCARRSAVCPEHSVCLGQTSGLGTVHLTRVVSVARLMSVGRHLELCVAHEDSVGREYHHRLRSGESAFWQIRTEKPLALLEVSIGADGDPGKIIECEAGRVDDLNLPRAMLLRILCETHASGDETHDFSRAGAFWALRHSPSYAAKFKVGPARYHVWRFPEEVVIRASAATKKGRRRVRWWRFIRARINPWYSNTRGNPAKVKRTGNQESKRGGIWAWRAAEGQHLADNQLQALMLASPELYAFLADTNAGDDEA